MNSIDFSVIIPVYNCEGYVERTLQSILRQSHKNIEVICVNDGSSDGSLAVLTRLAESDDRIRIIDKPNGGVSTARNAGLRAAQGKYVFFCDSDDLLQEGALEKAWNLCCEHDLDLLHFKYEIRYEDPEFEKVHRLKPRGYAQGLPQGVVTGTQFLRAVCENKIMMGTVWLYIFRREYLVQNGFFFDEKLKSQEDELFVALAAIDAGRVLCIEDQLYIYCMRHGSLMTNVDHGRMVFNYASIAARLTARAMELNETHPDKAQALMLDALVFYRSSRRHFVRMSPQEQQAILDGTDFLSLVVRGLNWWAVE